MKFQKNYTISQPKTHNYIILTQLNDKYGLKAVGPQGDKAIQKD